MARIEIRISEAEKEALKIKAEASSISVTELIKQSVKRVREFTLEDKDLARAKNLELNRIGNNLNQIAHFANRHKSNTEAIAIIAHLVAIERALKSC